MPADLIQGLLLLCIGMTSVFVILTVIVLSGRWMILILNRLSQTTPKLKTHDEDDDEVVIITALVHQLTGGKGRVLNISKPVTSDK
ncbi:MAG: OadG family protein [Saprospiraceae bacterium]|nr:OadG family protein [Saprospiraceae bacterium]